MGPDPRLCYTIRGRRRGAQRERLVGETKQYFAMSVRRSPGHYLISPYPGLALPPRVACWDALDWAWGGVLGGALRACSDEGGERWYLL